MEISNAREKAPTENIRWRSFIAASTSATAVGLAIGLGLPLLSIILEKRGIPSSLIGLNTAIAGLASMAAAPLTSKLAHRFSVPAVMLWSVLIAAISAVGFYYAKSFWAWFPLRFTFHGSITALFILSEFWINASSPPHKRGFALGVYATLLAIGFALGPLLFSILGSDGLLPFAVGSVIILTAAIPVFVARRECPVLDEKPGSHFMRYIFLVPTATAAVFIFGAVEAGGLSLFPIYATRAGFSESQAALLLTMMGVGSMVFQIPIGVLSDKMRDRRSLLSLIAVVGLAGSLTLPMLIENWIVTAVVLLFFGGSVAGLYTVGLSHLGARLTGSDLAAANAAFIFCYAMGTVVGPQAIGSAMDAFGKDGFAWSIAVFFGIYVLLSGLRLIFRPKRS
ncbi:MFS transporter [Rhizobium sp. L1K21]|uniref:MFS transporter n=1 Tax=Rhizobium sp. L1K21 TaxID=2954933 RepID=UPI0020938767|nr:MFS transporter [Rhizobium sp. L1K21]MCO6186021.1 MFS transporter [Rhizobium sp. L1K21]